MTTPASENNLTSDSDPKVTRLPSPVPVQPASPVPVQPAEPGNSSSDTSPDTWTAAAGADRPDLLGLTLAQRAERQGRDLLIDVNALLARRVNHPDGGDSTVEGILAQEKSQRGEINDEAMANSRKHGRLPRWQRSIPRYVLLFDFGMLLYFFSGVTNVDWGSPLSLSLAFAVVLAAMVTLLSYGFLSFTGHRLRAHKNHAGTIHREDVDAATRVAFIIGVTLIAVLAVLMFTRIWTEVLDALGGQAQVTALIIAIAVSVVNAAANFLVIGIHALDGSDQTARLDKLSDAVRGPLDRANELRTKAAKQVNHQS
jgi:hypothetical protein